MSENEKQANVPYFIHEGTMARMERVFKMTVIALVVALAVAVASFVINDSLWRKYCAALEARYQITEVQDGVYQQPDEGAD